MWDLDLSFRNIVLRIAISVLFGALIGLERQRRGNHVGVRTLMLVGLGSTLFVIAGEELVASIKDASRISCLAPLMAAVIGGVGFLGAGVTMRTEYRTEGITTAAAIWVAAGIGVAAGLGELVLAATCGIATVFTLLLALAVDRNPND